MARPGVGELLREWRLRRHRSQMDVALAVSVSTRHLSFVETGRSRPSPELVLAVAIELEVPLRERNVLLLAAGYAPRYTETSLDDPAMSRMRSSIQRMLDAHDPYPGVAIDRLWNVVLTNNAAVLLLDGIPEEVLGPSLNVYRVCLHPEGLAARTVNFHDWAVYLLGQLERSIVLTGDRSLAELAEEVRGYPNVAELVGARRAQGVGRSTVAHPLRDASRRRGAVDVHDTDDVRHTARRDARRDRRGAVLPRRRPHRGDSPRRASGCRHRVAVSRPRRAWRRVDPSRRRG